MPFFPPPSSRSIETVRPAQSLHPHIKRQASWQWCFKQAKEGVGVSRPPDFGHSPRDEAVFALNYIVFIQYGMSQYRWLGYFGALERRALAEKVSLSDLVSFRLLGGLA